MVIFHSYVSSAEGIWIVINSIQSARSARFLRETIWQSEVDSIYVCLWESGELGILAPENCGELEHELFPIGSMVLLYMVLHGSHHIPSIHPSHVSIFLPDHGSYGFGFFGFCSCKSSIIKDSDDSEHHQGKCWSQMLPSVWAPDAWTNGFHLTVWTIMDHRTV